MESAGATREATLAQAAATVGSAPRFEAYDHAAVASLLDAAADERAALHAGLGTARQSAIEMPLPLDVVPRHHADDALEAAEAELAALRAELARANAQLRRAGAPPATPAFAPTAPAAAAAPPPPMAAPVTAPAPPPAPEPEVAYAVPMTAPVPVTPPAPVYVLPREPFARTNGLLQVVTWSMVVAVVLIALLAWFG
jgi:outer membrane biosynthesis protein TonB